MSFLYDYVGTYCTVEFQYNLYKKWLRAKKNPYWVDNLFVKIQMPGCMV